MSQSTAKALRRQVYGDNAFRGKRSYIRNGLTILNHPASLRAIYQKAKRARNNGQ